MNSVGLIGTVATPPVYYCTEDARDLLRFQIRTGSPPGVVHHCLVWGPAALCLHEQLRRGERLLVRGELHYRSRSLRDGGVVQVPVVQVLDWSFLG